MKKNGKKTAKQDPGRQSGKSVLRERSTVIVLAIAAAVFLIAFFSLYSEDILHGAADIFWEYGDEIVEFEKARVTKVVTDGLEADDVADGASVGSQELEVVIGSGRYKGETMTVYNYIGPLSGVALEEGDGVTVTIKTHGDGSHSATVYEFNRIPVLAGFLILFFAVTLLVGGRTGLKSLIGLVFTVICLFTVLIPLLLKGAPTVITTFVICAYIALVCFTILGGVHRKTVSAFLGTLSGTFLAMVFGMAVQFLGKIDGLRLEDAEPLLQMKRAGAVIGLRGLLTAGIIISALGAVMDVAMSISSALEEVHAADPSMSRKDLFRSGMNIGRDMAGTMTNTLILAFLGSEFTLIIFLYARELTFYHLFSTAFVALETISGLSASIGLILAIPLTALISSALIKRNSK
ncbi:MAG: YibE/F family protein [Clostridia bacterium]|nr:YibE/F family protein [Clostridia bacterium]